MKYVTYTTTNIFFIIYYSTRFKDIKCCPKIYNIPELKFSLFLSFYRRIKIRFARLSTIPHFRFRVFHGSTCLLGSCFWWWMTSTQRFKKRRVKEGLKRGEKSSFPSSYNIYNMSYMCSMETQESKTMLFRVMTYHKRKLEDM